MFTYILSRLLLHTFMSLFFSCLIGALIGAVVGAIRRQIQDTINVGIAAYFLGSLLVCSVPPLTVPGSLETWGVGGGLGSIQVIFMVIFTILGGVVVSLIATTFGFKFFSKVLEKWILWILITIYVLMLILLYYSHLTTCQPSISYCYMK